MNRRASGSIAGALAAAAAAALAVGALVFAHRPPPRRPNVVVVLVDTLRADHLPL